MDNKIRDKHIKTLKSDISTQEERIQALFQLMNIADQKSLEAISNCLLNDTCEIVRHEAAFVLGEAAADACIETMEKVIENDPSLIVRHEALLALGTINNPSVIPFLRKQTKHKEYLVSESAKIALQRIGKDEPYRGPKHFEHLK